VLVGPAYSFSKDTFQDQKKRIVLELVHGISKDNEEQSATDTEIV
jgi:hypothetical protein